MLTLASPWFLLLLPLPFFVWRFMPAAKIQQNQALKVPFFSAMQQIAGQKQQGSVKKNHTVLLSIIWCLLVLAVAGPQWVGKPQPIQREGRNIMLAVDLSGSMQVMDMRLQGRPIDRLSIVKLAAQEFISKRQGDRLGLILFGDRAYLQTPLTYDRQTVLNMLHDATIGLAGQRTSIGDAIGLAIKRLQQVPKKSRVLILLTDGANNAGVLEPLQAGKMAKEDDIKIYTIGLGAEHMVTQSFFGQRMINPSSDLDETSLKEIAKLTGGQYFRATDTQQLAKIYATIDKLEPVKSDSAIFRPIKDYFYWPLGIAALLFLMLLAQLSTWTWTNPLALARFNRSKQEEAV